MNIINDIDVSAVDSELLQQRPHPLEEIIIQLARMLILHSVLVIAILQNENNYISPVTFPNQQLFLR